VAVQLYRPVLRSYVRRQLYTYINTFYCRSQRPRGVLDVGSAAARLLRLWVWIPSGGRDVCVFCLCCQVEVSATSWSLVQRSLTDCG